MSERGCYWSLIPSGSSVGIFDRGRTFQINVEDECAQIAIVTRPPLLDVKIDTDDGTEPHAQKGYVHEITSVLVSIVLSNLQA